MIVKNKQNLKTSAIDQDKILLKIKSLCNYKLLQDRPQLNYDIDLNEENLLDGFRQKIKHMKLDELKLQKIPNQPHFNMQNEKPYEQNSHYSRWKQEEKITKVQQQIINPKYIPRQPIDLRRDPYKYQSYLQNTYDGQFNVGYKHENDALDDIIGSSLKKLKDLNEIGNIFATQAADRPFRKYNDSPFMLSAPLILEK